MRYLALHIGIALLAFITSMTAAELLTGLFTPRSVMETIGPPTTSNSIPPILKEYAPPPPAQGSEVIYSIDAYSVDGLEGRVIYKPMPAYPRDAKAAGVSGTVAVQVVMDETGRVTAAMALGGPLLLRAAAVRAAWRARFLPLVVSGKPVKSFGTLTYTF